MAIAPLVRPVQNAPMYPRRHTTVDPSLPALSSYWVPKPSETDEEGYGLNFREVFALSDVTVAEAKGILTWERNAAEWASAQVTNEPQFESVATYLEAFNPDNELDDPPFGVDLPPDLRDSSYCLWGLELGVSGLSHVMAATGFFPVASCRSHFERSWSSEPIVFFASDERRLHEIQPLVASTGCGLGTDLTRGKPLLVVNAPSIVELMRLAQQLFEKRQQFRVLPKTSRRGHGGRWATPPTLF